MTAFGYCCFATHLSDGLSNGSRGGNGLTLDLGDLGGLDGCNDSLGNDGL